MKFKIGDIVKIINPDNGYVNEVGKVIECSDISEIYLVDFHNVYYRYDENELELVKSTSNESSGVKYSNDKVPLFTVLKQFREAFIEVAKRSQQGHEKYKEFDKDWQNFARLPDADEEYGNAELRHLLEYGEDTKLEHYAANAWNALARLQVYLNNNKSDNRT